MMFKHLKNQSGMSFILLIVVVSGVIITTMLSIGFKMHEWNGTRKAYQMKVDAMSVFEELAQQTKLAYDIAQSETIDYHDPASNCPGNRTTVKVRLLNETGKEASFCYPQNFCISHPTDPATVLCDTAAGSSDDNIRIRTSRDFDFTNGASFNFQPVPPEGLWARSKFEFNGLTHKVARGLQKVVLSMDNTSMARIVDRPNLTVPAADTMNRSRIIPLEPASSQNYKNCRTVLMGGNLACIVFNVCMNLNAAGCDPLDPNDGWFKQSIGVKIAD